MNQSNPSPLTNNNQKPGGFGITPSAMTTAPPISSIGPTGMPMGNPTSNMPMGPMMPKPGIGSSFGMLPNQMMGGASNILGLGNNPGLAQSAQTQLTADDISRLLRNSGLLNFFG